MVVVQTGENRFPLREAVKAQLESLEDLPVLRLEDDIRALEEEAGTGESVRRESEILPEEEIFHGDPVVHVDPPKHESITLSRLTHYGLSPGCVACESGEGEHTSSCRERFDKLLKGVSSHFPRALQRALIRGSLKEIS